jgi:hypothetical protein
VIVPDRDCVLLVEELLDGEGVDVGEAPFDIVAVCEAVLLGVNDDVALFVGVTDDDRVGLLEDVPLRVGLPVTVPERELV